MFVLATCQPALLGPYDPHITHPCAFSPVQVEVSDPRWGTYRQRGEALGIPILAFDCVCQEAVETAAHIVLSMLADADGSIVESMVEAGRKWPSLAATRCVVL